MTEGANKILESHLVRDDLQEDLCFALYSPSSGSKRVTGLIREIILPNIEDRNVHGNASFNSCYFNRVIDIALKKGMGIIFLHSHPVNGWQDMSPDDIQTESILAPSVAGATDLPLIGMTIGADGYWSARFWIRTARNKYRKHWCESVRIMGESFKAFFNDSILPRPRFGEEFLRTLSSWGEEKQDELSRLKIGVIGMGSVGSIVAESLVRTGIQNITLIDFDRIEKRNLDRLIYATKFDIGKQKVAFYKEKLKESTILPTEITACPYSIIEEDGFKTALNCDILFSCVDRPWPRYVLDMIAYAHLIPVIDGGIGAYPDKLMSNLADARWRTQVISAGRMCMQCLGQYTPEDVALEQSGLLENPTYTKNLSKDHFSNRGENVFSFSLGLAAMEMNQLLSFILRPLDVYLGIREYDFISSTIKTDFEFQCKSNCSIESTLGMGNSINELLISHHEVAERARCDFAKRMSKSKKERLYRVIKYLSNLFSGNH